MVSELYWSSDHAGINRELPEHETTARVEIGEYAVEPGISACRVTGARR
ncbi:MAG TPA: hypothetical protein VG711_04335 [Phycisphaerales bacterium]|nr:hypothetical protein [Phycisphaerales bacterium]